MSAIAFVGLGANLGDSATTLHGAIEALAKVPRTRLLAASRLYRTPAWGLTEQPDFLNAVAMIDTTLAPMPLLSVLLDIERGAGRDRARPGAERWGPRTLDLDLLLYGDDTFDEPGLQVPHPHLHERAFALIPLLEIAPLARIPGRGAVADLVAGMASSDIQAVTY